MAKAGRKPHLILTYDGKTLRIGTHCSVFNFSIVPPCRPINRVEGYTNVQEHDDLTMLINRGGIMLCKSMLPVRTVVFCCVVRYARCIADVWSGRPIVRVPDQRSPAKVVRKRMTQPDYWGHTCFFCFIHIQVDCSQLLSLFKGDKYM